MQDSDPFAYLDPPGAQRLKAMREDLREDALRRQDHLATHLFVENDALVDALSEMYLKSRSIKDVLLGVLEGLVDLEDHEYLTCTDDFTVNVDRGCARCIVISFTKEDE